MADNKAQLLNELYNGTPSPAGAPAKGKKRRGFLLPILAFTAAILIILGVIGSSVFMMIKNNVNDMAVKYRKEISRMPIFSLALPVKSPTEDVDILSHDELKKKYLELLQQKDEMEKHITALDKDIKTYQQYKAELDTLKKNQQSKENEIAQMKTSIQSEQKVLEEDKKKLSELIASSDKEGFKEYFEKVDAETAKAVYTQIMQEQKTGTDTKKFVSLYESMKPDEAAKIFNTLGEEDIQLVTQVLQSMQKENAAAILAKLDVKFAAKITQKMGSSITK